MEGRMRASRREGIIPDGVRLIPLTTHPDDRGRFTEIYRQSWDTGVGAVQWNAVSSRAGVLRGMHVHPRHDDYLIVLTGRALIGLHDMRVGSPTEGQSAVVEMTEDAINAMTIPHGVGHAFYFPTPSFYVNAVSHYWDTADELACRWDDPDLRMPWSIEAPVVSQRDASAPPLRALKDQLAPHQPLWRA